MVDTVAIVSVALTCLLVMYSAAIYPAFLSIAAKLLRRPWIQSNIQPKVTVIIPAHNEQAVIARKLDNILATTYPSLAIEIFVASDCSTDDTDAIVRSYAPRVRLIRAAVRSGKQVCLNLAVAEATGDILLFTDAAGLLAPDAIALLVRHFADPSIGAASSAIRVQRAAGEGEGMYMGADCAWRVREGEISSIVGCVGPCYAMRRECFRPFHPADCDDFAAVFNVAACGKRTIMDPQVVCEMLPARDAKGELIRKVRTMAGALDTIWRYRRQIMGSAPPSLLWFIASHKVCRWLVPLSVCWAGLAITVGALFGHWSWCIPFAAGLCAAGIGLISWRFSWQHPRLAFLKPFCFFVVSIWAGLVAWWKVVAGKKQVVWQPTLRLP
jgi:cellulose synthase/poly-beta-1,6-N-acetylglucosamine synthase-like glycosyltransferase